LRVGAAGEAVELAEALDRESGGIAPVRELLIRALVRASRMGGDGAAMLDRAESLARAAAEDPGRRGKRARSLLIQVLAADQRVGEAREMLDAELSVPPDPEMVEALVGWLELASSTPGAYARSRAVLAPLLERERSGRDAPARAMALVVLARMLRVVGLGGWSDLMLDEAQRTHPGSATVGVERARRARLGGDIESARAGLAPIVDRAERSGLLDRPSIDSEERASKEALLELAAVLDASGEHVAGFDAAVRAQRSLAGDPEESRHSPGVAEQIVDRYRRHVEAVDLSRWEVEPSGRAGDANGAGPEGLGGSPIFFVGFPRSGTTLLEQMLGSHPDLVGTGERTPLGSVVLEAQRGAGHAGDGPEAIDTLDDTGVRALRARYAEHARAIVGRESAARCVVIDKLPLNIVRLAWVRRLFPESRVLVAVRDPRDCCVSCMFQRFQANPWMVHLMAPERAASMYARVMGLYVLSRERLGLRVMESRYEDLVADPGARLREVLDFLGRRWDESVLGFADGAGERVIETPSADAVSRPIGSGAVGRWRRYGDRIAPIEALVGPFIDRFGYEPGEAGR